MTLKDIINKIKEAAASLPGVNSAEEGNIYDLMNGNRQVKYASVVITQGTHRYGDNQMLYSFNIFYIDRLVDDLESNRLEIQSNGIEVLKNIINQICEEENVDRTEATIEVWTEKFSDLCAGAYAQVTFQVPTDDCFESYN